MDGNRGKDLVLRAIEMSASGANISDDLVAALFPKSQVLITDRMMSHAHQYLRAIVAAVETEICLIATQHFGVSNEAVATIGNGEQSHSYPRLLDAGLLETKALMEHVFVQSQLAELGALLLQKVSGESLEGSLTRYLDHDDTAVSEASMALLAAQSRSDARIANISELPAEMLHSLTWPITATVEKLAGYSGSGLTDAAEKILADHDESASVASRALRMAQLVDQQTEEPDHGNHPLEDGLHLFLAILAQRSELAFDEIVKFTADPNMIRLVVLMRALDFSSRDALSIFAALDGSGGILTAASYNEIDVEASRALVQQWRMNSAYRDAKHALSITETGHSGR